MKPLLSIVIATKNRVNYCINSIEAILNVPDNDFELVVQDNTDNFDLKNYIESNITDLRLIYHYTPPPFSSIDNFNAAIDLANGEYLCLIGDDDGICTNIFEMVKWAKDNNIESVCPGKLCEYIWPQTFDNQRDSTLTVPQSNGRIIKGDPESTLHEFFKSGALDYLKMGFPKLYHGIVKKSCLERIKNRTGYYIGGLSPDIYAAISLSCVVDSHFVIDYPFTIAGACRSSATAASENGQHSGQLKDAPHFRDRGNYLWDSLMPDIYSIETIWAETALKALSDMERIDLRQEFNSDLFLAKNILRNPGKIKYFTIQTFVYLRENKVGLISYFKLIFLLIFLITKFFIRNILRLKNETKENIESITFKDIQDIKEATITASKILSEKPIIFDFNRNEN